MTHPPVTDESGLSQLAQLQNRFWACYVEGFHILSGTRSLCCIISIHIHEHSGFLKYRKSVVPLISWQLDSPKLCTMRSVYYLLCILSVLCWGISYFIWYEILMLHYINTYSWAFRIFEIQEICCSINLVTSVQNYVPGDRVTQWVTQCKVNVKRRDRTSIFGNWPHRLIT